MSWQTSSPAKLTDMPRYSLPKLRRRQAEFREWLAAFTGVTLRQAHRESLKRQILKELPYYDARADEANRLRIISAVDRYLLSLEGRFVDDALLEEKSISLAEWIDRFEAGKYEPWNLHLPTWALLRVLDMERRLAKEGRHYLCRYQAWGGSPAGMTWEAHITGGQVQQLLRDIGLPKYEKYDDMEFGGMFLIAWLKPSAVQIEIDMAGASASVLTHNKKLFRQRQGRCRGGFWSGMCINCSWGRKECALARHEHLYADKIQCANYRWHNGAKVYHRGYRLTRNQGVCLDCLNRSTVSQEVLLTILKQNKKRGAAK
jgi:hypothetical protein